MLIIRFGLTLVLGFSSFYGLVVLKMEQKELKSAYEGMATVKKSQELNDRADAANN